MLYKFQALERASRLAPLLAEMKARGLSSRPIAAELNLQQVATPMGASWHPQTVLRALRRAGLFPLQASSRKRS